MSTIALNVGELVAYLRLDDQDFQRTLSKSGSGLQNLGQSAKRYLQPLATGFAATATAGAGVAAMLLRQGVAYNTLQQQSRAALTSITGSAKDANAQMDKLDDFARNSPFSKATFITAQQQMLGFGIESEKVIPYLDAIQNATAAIGGSNQEIGDLAFIMAQISSAGKITGQDLMQFGSRGVNAAKLIGDQMGKTENEIRESITKGTLDADKALDALAEGMAKTYEGAAAGVKDTWIGATDRIKAATRDLGALLASPFVDPNGGGMALDWANGLADLLRAVESQAKPLIKALLPALIPLSGKITDALQAATDAVNEMDPSEVMAFFSRMGEYATPIAAVSAGLFAMGTNVGILARMGLTLNPFVAALVAVVATSEEAREASVRLAQSLAPLGDEFADLLRAGGDLANTVLTALVDILIAVADGAGAAGGPVDILAMALEGMTEAVRFVNDLIAPLAGWMADAAGAASGLSGPIMGVTLALVAMRNVNVGKIIGALTSGLQNAQSTWQASQGTLQALGREAGVMNTAMLTARTGAQRLGGALKGLAVANAPMLAITALAAVIGHFVQQSAEAKARAEQLVDTFDELTGAATADTDTMILTQLNEQLDAGDWDRLKELGYSYTDVINAVKEGGPALDEMRQALNDASIAAGGLSREDYRTRESLNKTHKALGETSEAYGVAAEQAAEVAGQTQELADAQAEAAQQSSATASALSTFEDALATLSDEASSAEQRLDALNDIMDIMAGGTPSVTEATIKAADALRDATSAAEGFGFSQEELNSILADDGSLNLQSEAVSALRGEMDDLVGAAQRQADALIQAGDEAGAIQVYKDLEDDLRALAETAGVENPKAIDALVDSLGLLPPEVMVDFQANGADAMSENIQMVQQHITDLPDNVMTYINGDTTGIETKVDETGLRMAYVASMSADPNIGADDVENANIVAAAVARLDELDRMKPTPEVKAEKKALERVVQGAKVDLDSIPDKQADVTAKTFGFSDVSALRKAIERVKSKTVTVRTNYVETGKPLAKPGSQGRGGHYFSGVVGDRNADGNVYTAPGVKMFANGAENHVAQIAPAGAWRVWAEEETGGEAYVPLALSKRARSLAIMHDVASRFGHVMVPVNGKRYADGGTDRPPVAATPGVGAQFGDINVTSQDPALAAALVRSEIMSAMLTASTGHHQ